MGDMRALGEWSCPVPYHLVPTAMSESFRDMPPGWTGLPLPPHPGGFGTPRRHHTHEGVDIYVADGTPVTAVEDGMVVATEPFTGVLCRPASPWWEDTWAIIVEGASGVVLYGEISIEPGLHPDVPVRRGQRLGTVTRVLRKDKGRPTSMLHLELHESGNYDWSIWTKDQPRPGGLRDPTPALMVSATRAWTHSDRSAFVKAGNLVIPIASIEKIDLSAADGSEIAITWGGGQVTKAVGFDAIEALTALGVGKLRQGLTWFKPSETLPFPMMPNPMAQLLTWSRRLPFAQTARNH